MSERLQRLETNIAELRAFRDRHDLADVQMDRELQWALRYGLLESIQAVIDIACSLCLKYNLGNPTTYSDCITLLLEFHYVDSELSPKLLGMVGLRNLLVHEYARLDTERLYRLLDSVGDFARFAESVRDYV
jgi:uncharacterized protein YutE (UPF0331/DUF86 family)